MDKIKTSTDNVLPYGKISLDILKKNILPYHGEYSDDLIVRPDVGADFCAIKLSNEYLIVSSDPITGIVDNIGNYAVNINANDIATSGNRPRFIQSIILLPSDSKLNDLSTIAQQIDLTAKKLGITITGGHTEISEGIVNPIVIISCFTLAKSFVTSAGAQVNDSILMTKTAGIEGTSILSSKYSKKLTKLPAKTISSAQNYLKNISIVNEAEIAFNTKGVTSMHDPTEGGILGGLYEMAEASGLGFTVDASSIPISIETNSICNHLNVDPLKLIGSGSLLISSPQNCKNDVIHSVQQAGIQITEIGMFTEDDCKLDINGNSILINSSPVDELWNLSS